MEKIASAKKLEAEGRAAEAAALYEKAFDETDEDWMAVKAGELYRAAGNAKKGRQVIDRVIGCGNPIIYDRLLRFYFDTGDHKGASDLFLELFTDADALAASNCAFGRSVVRKERFGNNMIWRFEGNCWGLLRLSGTEPIVRIFAEAEDREKTQKIIGALKRSLENCVRKG